MKSGVYKIINPEGKVYIGCSNNVEKRKKDYQNCNIPNQRLILESIKYYGWSNHDFEILEYTKDLINKEKYYIKKYNSYHEGLNCNEGGGGISTHSEETKKIISEKGKANKGKRVNSHWKGKNKDKEYSKKLSMALKNKPSHRKGKSLPQLHIENISKGKKGKPNLLNAKVVLQYDTNGNFIQEYPSIEIAAKSVGGNPTAISNCLKKGGNATSCSYIWLYKN